MDWSAEKKNNFFLFLGRKFFVYFLESWDLFPYTPSTLMGVQSVL